MVGQDVGDTVAWQMRIIEHHRYIAPTGYAGKCTDCRSGAGRDCAVDNAGDGKLIVEVLAQCDLHV